MSGSSQGPSSLVVLIEAAARRLSGRVRETRLVESAPLSERSGARVLLKLEGEQQTGSFKFRGALNKLLLLGPEGRRRPISGASSGNHALALCRAMQEVGARGVLFVPRSIAPAKAAALRRCDAELHVQGEDCVEAELAARAWAERQGGTYVSPYNDLEVVAGQGSIGVELDVQAPRLDAVFVTVGGGGLIAGIAAYLEGRRPEIEVVGCQPEHSAAMAAAVAAGRIVEVEHRPTLSDGSAGGIEAGAVTFELCRRFVDRYVLVSEEEIARAMRLLLREHRLVVEGAAGVAVAGLLREGERLAGKRVAVVIGGRNVALSTLKQLLRPTQP